jgi:DNA-binding response OmpR family regulator
LNETLEGNKHGKNTPRVLLVDDESDIRMIIQKGLSNEGFQVDVSGDPVEIAAT